MRARAALLAVAALAACKVGPDYERPDLELPEDWREAEALQLSPEASAELANTAWWSLLGDPALDALIDEALRENRDLRASAARLEAFAAQVGVASSDLWPKLGYGAAASRSRTSQLAGPTFGATTRNRFELDASFAWSLDVWGRTRRAVEAASADLAQVDEARSQVALALVTNVATGYVTLRSLDSRLRIARETAESRAATLKLFEDRLAGGVAAELQVAQARSEHQQALAAIPFFERSVRRTENALSVLAGRNPGEIERGKPIEELVAPAIPADLPSALLERRPDLRGAEQVLVAANARVGVARSLWYPDIALTGTYGQASEELDDLFDADAALWNLAAGLAGPLFTAGEISGEVDAAEALRREAVEFYVGAVQNAFREVEDALVEARTTRVELEAQALRVEALVDYARLARVRYDNGYASYIEVLDAERSLFAAQLELAESQDAVIHAVVGVYEALGGGWLTEARAVADDAESARAAEREAGAGGADPPGEAPPSAP